MMIMTMMMTLMLLIDLSLRCYVRTIMYAKQEAARARVGGHYVVQGYSRSLWLWYQSNVRMRRPISE